jgi:hypothetical protein
MRLLPLLLIAATAAHASPWDILHERSVSRSRQFIVYEADPNARAAVAMDAEDVKDKFLELLDTNDNWQYPIVIQVTPFDAANPTQPQSDLQFVKTEDGWKLELNVVVGDDPRQAHFPQQLVRALLLEFAYRDQTTFLAPGAAYAQPPTWLVDGIASLTADPDPGANAGLFQSLIQSGKAPTLATFLSENPDVLDSPSLTLYSACSMSLVQLLSEMPNGRVRLQGFIRHWPGANADPEAELLKAFPDLGSDNQNLEKWWSLGLASQSATDRYQGMSLADTGQQLDSMLTFDVVIDKNGKTKSFTLDQYLDFAKAPGATAALNVLSVRLLGLEADGSPLMREVVAAYQGLVVDLARHQSTHLKERLAALTAYRSKLLDHMDQIADYLNWYEATQRTQASGAFDEYIRTADEIDTDIQPHRTDAITKYMDSVELQLAQ